MKTVDVLVLNISCLHLNVNLDSTYHVPYSVSILSLGAHYCGQIRCHCVSIESDHDNRKD